MNRIIVSREEVENISNGAYEISFEKTSVNLNITDKVELNEINDHNLKKLDIVVNDNSNLIFNKFCLSENINLEINIIQKKNSRVEFNYSFLTKKNANIVININMLENNNYNNFVVRGVSESCENIKIVANGNIEKNTFDNELIEDIRVLSLNDCSVAIIPNIYVATNNAVANHFTTAGSIDEDSLFYLTSKGLSEDNAKILITEGFLTSNLKVLDSLFARIKEILKNK